MGKKRKMTDHHRKARCFGGTRENNISRVPEHSHRAYHLLFGAGHPEQIAMILNRTWIDKDWIIVAVRKDTL